MTVMVQRTQPRPLLTERASYQAWMDYHRATLEWKCEGLTDEQLRAMSVPPSSLSLLGLVRHMAEVEHGWFRAVLAGEPDVEDFDAWDVETASTSEAFAWWHSECARSRAIADAMNLDQTGVLRETENVSLRWVYVHMIEEYARHNGHADLLRESIDGATGD
jgi:hypothetical protein